MENIFIEYKSIFLAYMFVTGAIVGSFLNVVAYRLPIMLANKKLGQHVKYNLVTPGSACPICKTPIKLRHNIPIFSYFALNAACAKCKGVIPARYMVIELMMAVFFLMSFALLGFTKVAMLACVFEFFILLATLIFVDDKFRESSFR